jgi:hypothetical protein
MALAASSGTGAGFGDYLPGDGSLVSRFFYSVYETNPSEIHARAVE